MLLAAPFAGRFQRDTTRDQTCGCPASMFQFALTPFALRQVGREELLLSFTQVGPLIESRQQ